MGIAELSVRTVRISTIATPPCLDMKYLEEIEGDKDASVHCALGKFFGTDSSIAINLHTNSTEGGLL